MQGKPATVVEDEILAETADFVRTAITEIDIRWDYESSQRLEIIATAFTAACETTSKSVLLLLERGFAFEALILSRSDLDAAAKAWRLLLADEHSKDSILADFDLSLAAEIRRKRNVSKSALDTAQELNFLSDQYAKIINDPTELGIPELSGSKADKANQRFAFGNLAKEVEEESTKRNMPIDLGILRMHYANISGLSHISPTALLTLDNSQRTDVIGQGLRSSQTATVCGVLILVWYYLQVFWVLPKGKQGQAEKEAYETGLITLQKATELCDAFGNFSISAFNKSN